MRIFDALRNLFYEKISRCMPGNTFCPFSSSMPYLSVPYVGVWQIFITWEIDRHSQLYLQENLIPHICLPRQTKVIFWKQNLKVTFWSLVLYNWMIILSIITKLDIHLSHFISRCVTNLTTNSKTYNSNVFIPTVF